MDRRPAATTSGALVVATVLVISIVIAYMLYKKGVICPSKPCPPPNPCPPGPCPRAEAALLSAANAVYNDAKTVVAGLWSWLQPALASTGMSAADIKADPATVALQAFSQYNPALDSLPHAQQSFASAVPLLNAYVYTLTYPSSAVSNAIAMLHVGEAYDAFAASVSGVVSDMAAVKKAIDGYLSG